MVMIGVERSELMRSEAGADETAMLCRLVGAASRLGEEGVAELVGLGEEVRV